MRTRKPGTSPSMQPDATDQRNASGLNREIQSKIGQQLRAIYDDVVQEGVPDRFTELLKQLDQPKNSQPSAEESGSPSRTPTEGNAK
jgi:hypothetical protein